MAKNSLFRNSVGGYNKADVTAYIENLNIEFEKKIDEKYIVKAASCSSKAQYAYVCACGEKSAETYEYGNVAPHVFDKAVAEDKYLASNATCVNKATYYYSCVCGAKGTETFESGVSSGVHAFNKMVATDEYLAAEATCQSVAKYYYSCECGEKGTETFEYGEANGHEPAEEWTEGEETHWHACANCDDRLDETAHIFDQQAIDEISARIESLK
jgi:hypothetical protein